MVPGSFQVQKHKMIGSEFTLKCFESHHKLFKGNCVNILPHFQQNNLLCLLLHPLKESCWWCDWYLINHTLYPGKVLKRKAPLHSSFFSKNRTKKEESNIESIWLGYRWNQCQKHMLNALKYKRIERNIILLVNGRELLTQCSWCTKVKVLIVLFRNWKMWKWSLTAQVAIYGMYYLGQGPRSTFWSLDAVYTVLFVTGWLQQGLSHDDQGWCCCRNHFGWLGRHWLS